MTPVRPIEPFRGALTLATALVAALAAAQEPRLAEWRLVEAAPETLEYRNALRNGAFDDAGRGYLLDIALPQLALEANRPTIDRVRRRLRDIACDPSGEQRAMERAGQVVVDFMTALANDAGADLAVRVNAMLLVGEVNGKGGIPLPAALAPLVTAVADARMPAAVRIAAAAGLDRHVEATDGELPAAVSAAVVKLVAGTPDTDPVAAEWLLARAFDMLSRAGSKAPREAVAAAAAILADAARSPDVRVRAAAVVGAAAAPDSGIDGAALVAAIRDIAVTTLTTEATRDAPVDLGSGLPGSAPPPGGGFSAGMPGGAGVLDDAAGAGAVQTQACRRAAWRLDVLATALGGVDGAGGLARLEGPSQAEAQRLAAALRAAAVQIDAEPDVISIREALEAVSAPGAAAAGGAAKPEPGAGQPAAQDNPFGQ